MVKSRITASITFAITMVVMCCAASISAYAHQPKHAQMFAAANIQVMGSIFGSVLDQVSSAETELNDIRSRIKKIQANLSNDQATRDRVTVELEKIEREVAEAARKLNALEEELDIKEAILKDARAEQAKSKKILKIERDALIKQIQAAYIMGKQENFKLLINQEDPAEVGRMLVYYDYLNKARSARMIAVKEQLDRLAELELEIDVETKALLALNNSQRVTVSRLEKNRKTRHEIVKKLSEAIEQGGTDLERAAAAEKQLAQLLESLARDLRDIPPDIGSRRPFAKQKGRLRWPVKGRRLNRYKAWREPGKIRWGGVMIAADPGAAVRAVSYGRVVFADWMPRFGMLIIIEHDSGYMSLYAHNETIFKRVGDKVEPGQVIATVGDSGGQKQAGLYFEVRRKGNTVNPAIWCKRAAPS